MFPPLAIHPLIVSPVYNYLLLFDDYRTESFFILDMRRDLADYKQPVSRVRNDVGRQRLFRIVARSQRAMFVFVSCATVVCNCSVLCE